MNNIFIYELTGDTILKALFIFGIFMIFKNYIVKTIISFVQKFSEKHDYKLVYASIDSIEKPLKLFIFITGIICALSVLPLAPGIAVIYTRVYRVAVIICITNGMLNLVNAYRSLQMIDDKIYEKNPALKTLLPLLSKAIKFFIILIAVVAIAVEFGFEELKSLLTGVGIGGLAVAMAAQDLLKNVFGGFIILTDKSFNTGDFIKIDSNEGVVEEVGIRSTKVRTLDQEVIVVPNSKFADGSVVNYSKRGSRRVCQTLGATYSTTSGKLQGVIDKIRDMLISDENILRDTVTVRFDGFGSSSLDILVVYLVNTPDLGEYLRVKEAINFKIMKIFEDEGVEFAFPSLSLYMEKSN